MLTALSACSSAPALPRSAVGPFAAAGSRGYEFGAGDRLQVTVFRHAALSGELTLDATGTVAMPLVGQSAADDLTTRELESAIEQQLQEQDYLVDPHVSIEVVTHRPVYVLARWRSPASTNTFRA